MILYTGGLAGKTSYTTSGIGNYKSVHSFTTDGKLEFIRKPVM